MNILLRLSPLRSLSLDELFIAIRLSSKQSLRVFEFLLAYGETLAMEVLGIKSFVHLGTEPVSRPEDFEVMREFMSPGLTKRKSLPQAGPIPAAKCFSTLSRPSASLSCTLIVLPSAVPHNLATSSAYSSVSP